MNPDAKDVKDKKSEWKLSSEKNHTHTSVIILGSEMVGVQELTSHN